MTTPAPKTQNWKAWQNLQPPVGETVELTVTGDVQVTNTSQTPHLTEHQPAGFKRRILLLELMIATSGVGNPALGWREVVFKKDIMPGEYASIEVLWEGERIGTARSGRYTSLHEAGQER